MKPSCNVATLIERYFTERLMRQRNVSANTIASYRDTFRLLFTFAQLRLRKPPSALTLDDLEAPFVGAFLTDLETERGAGVRTRNLRLTAIRRLAKFSDYCQGRNNIPNWNMATRKRAWLGIAGTELIPWDEPRQ